MTADINTESRNKWAMWDNKRGKEATWLTEHNSVNPQSFCLCSPIRHCRAYARARGNEANICGEIFWLLHGALCNLRSKAQIPGGCVQCLGVQNRGGGVAKAAMTPKLDPLGEQVCSSGGLKVTQPGLICWTVIWHNPCGWNNLCLNTTSSSTRWKVNKAKQRYSTDNTDRWKLKLKTHPVPSMLWQAFIVLRQLSFHCWEIKRLSFGGAWSG